MSEELKPCPFCGGEAKLPNSGGVFWAICNNCCTYQQITHDRAEAIAAWNKRQHDAIIEATERLADYLRDENLGYPVILYQAPRGADAIIAAIAIIADYRNWAVEMGEKD